MSDLVRRANRSESLHLAGEERQHMAKLATMNVRLERMELRCQPCIEIGGWFRFVLGTGTGTSRFVVRRSALRPQRLRRFGAA